MSEEFLAKMQSFFKDGLIINSLAREHLTQSLIQSTELLKFYKEINKNCKQNPMKDNYIACALYYLSIQKKREIDDFVKQIENKIKKEDPINNENMFLIFNIIEFEKKYKMWSIEALNNYLNYLNKFSIFKKNKEHTILFYYYQSVLYEFLQNYQEYEKCSLNLISLLLNEKENKKASVNLKLIDYLEFNNEFLKILLRKNQIEQKKKYYS